MKVNNFKVREIDGEVAKIFKKELALSCINFGNAVGLLYLFEFKHTCV